MRKFEFVLPSKESKLLVMVVKYKEQPVSEYLADIVKMELSHYLRDLRFHRWLKKFGKSLVSIKS